MKASRFSDAQKAFILKQGADSMPVADICLKAGISQATYFNRKRKNDSLLPTEMRRLKQLEDENAKLRKVVADLSLDKEMLEDVFRRKPLRPVRKRKLVDEVRGEWNMAAVQGLAREGSGLDCCTSSATVTAAQLPPRFAEHRPVLVKHDAREAGRAEGGPAHSRYRGRGGIVFCLTRESHAHRASPQLVPCTQFGGAQRIALRWTSRHTG